MMPQPELPAIQRAIDALRGLITHAALLRYFYGYEVAFEPGMRAGMPARLYVSHAQPAAASLLAVFFSDHIGLQLREPVEAREGEEERYGITLLMDDITANHEALCFIAPQVDAYCQALRMLRECPDVVQVQLRHNRLQIYCRMGAAQELMGLDGMAVVDHGDSVSSMFKMLTIRPQEMMAQLPALYAAVANLAGARQARAPRKLGQPGIEQV